jgi:hypothetical protein
MTRTKKIAIGLIIANEIRGVIMAAPFAVVLWQSWF